MLQSLQGSCPPLQDEATAHLQDLPPNTFGGAYATFMDRRHFHADDRWHIIDGRGETPWRAMWIDCRRRRLRCSFISDDQLSNEVGPRRTSSMYRPPVRFIADEEVAYAAQRSREVHDMWHVLFGCHTNVFGELALKAVEYVQARERHCECHELRK